MFGNVPGIIVAFHSIAGACLRHSEASDATLYSPNQGHATGRTTASYPELLYLCRKQ